MAIIRPGPLAQAISGSIGGITFTQTRGRSSVGAKPKKTNPRTIRQIAQRNKVSLTPLYWAATAPSRKLVWKNLALQTDLRGRLGTPYHVTGRNLFNRVFAGPLQQSTPLYAADPQPFALPKPLSLTCNFSSTGTYEVEPDPYLNDATVHVVFFGARPVSSNTYAAPQYWRYLTYAPSTTQVHDITSAFQAAWGTLRVDEVVYVRVFFWSRYFLPSPRTQQHVPVEA